MRKLRISADLPLPLDWIQLATVIYGARGSGKTTLGRVFAEEVHGMRQRFCAIDLKGDWWGLKSTADGKGEGLPVVIFGGDHADLPLEVGAGAFVAKTIAGLDQSTILDLEHFSKGKQVRFLGEFFAALYDANREPLLLLLDEAQRYAPQGRMIDPESAKCLGAVEDLVKLGRKHGIGPVLFTQRGSGLNKEVSELCDLLVAFRTPGPLDQDRVKDWLDANTTKAQRDEVMGKLAGLATGTAVFASGHPDLKLFGVHAVRRPETFDSSATPKVGQRRIEPKRLAKPDLEAIRAKMTDAIERAKADDPKALRARIAELEKAAKVKVPAPAPAERVEVPVFDEKRAERLRLDIVARVREELDLCCSSLQSGAGGLVQAYANDVTRPKAVSVPSPGRLRVAIQPRTVETSRQKAERVERGSGESMPGAERKILTALAQHGGEATKRKVALVAGYAIDGGGFKNALGALRSKGWITGSDVLRILDAGRLALGTVEPLPTGADLLAYWCSNLGKAERSILEALADAQGRLAKGATAERAGYEANGGGFKNALGRLRTLQLITGSDELALSEELFD